MCAWPCQLQKLNQKINSKARKSIVYLVIMDLLAESKPAHFASPRPGKTAKLHHQNVGHILAPTAPFVFCTELQLKRIMRFQRD